MLHGISKVPRTFFAMIVSCTVTWFMILTFVRHKKVFRHGALLVDEIRALGRFN